MSDETRTLDAVNLRPEAAPEAFLVVYLDGRTQVVPLPEGVEVTIGRSRGCTLFVDHEQVSRRHTRIVRRGADVLVSDLGSRNGTRVAGVRVEGERRAQAGELIAAGPLVAMVAVAAAGARLGDVVSTETHVVADPAMARVYDLVRKVGPSDMAVLITGETGAGKERVAEAVHAASPRGRGPFVRLHVAALPETLIESELFGHERGAFTGADKRRVGYFETAAGGTLFLDEIGELAASVQAKLLRALETRRIVRLGSTEEVAVDVRVVAATHRDLPAEVAAGRFRQDLYFRLAAFRIHVPPLRERRTEIPLLAALFARALGAARGTDAPAITPDAMARLVAYDWPGNVRELKHVVEAAAVLALPGAIDAAHLPQTWGAAGAAASVAAPPLMPPPADEPVALGQAVDKTERAAIVAALDAVGGNQTHAARRLGISRRALLYKMKRLAIRSVRRVENGPPADGDGDGGDDDHGDTERDT